ncbi:hypothetical protein [Pseudomonas botevensis]|uniref:hypothetical protein n=1 Tax=Pseudomonas botevensis TaxID=2842352 RepID=UPI001C3C478E|nr:hypothetical protein [Pseudomonas botevensis]MBV4478023.1 hypothetical protein [Pseudomonas botevensis]
MIEIIDLPADTHLSHSAAEQPIGHYFLAPRLADRLPQPDLPTGLRSSGAHTYVDLVDGGTVLIGKDAQQHYRARSPNELTPSGPPLRRVEGTLQWRQVAPGQHSPQDSQLLVSRHPMVDDDPRPPPPKRRHITDDGKHERNPLNSLRDPWNSWNLLPQHASTGDLNIEGVRYKTLPRGPAPDHPIVYIKNPTHLIYDFALFERVLRTDMLQQPRGAIRVPPANHWQIDPSLPFEAGLADTLARYFPDLSYDTRQHVARQQFILANGEDQATGTGLTLLRQAFNDWRNGTRNPRPELVDPLLMLRSLEPASSEGHRLIDLPVPGSEGALRRLDFDPALFPREWREFMASHTALEMKRFTSALLTRHGYRVFHPVPGKRFAAVVFRRPEHDVLFFLSLRRIKGNKIRFEPRHDPRSSRYSLSDQVGLQAAEAVESAHAAGKVIWLRGGPQTLATEPDTFVIIRDNVPRF